MQTNSTKASSVRRRWLRIGLINMILVLLILLTAAIVFNTAVPTSQNSQADAVFVVTRSKGYPALAPQTASGQTVTANSFFKAFDADKIWSISESIQLFEHSDPHVGLDGTGRAAHVIAPGTRNNYVFGLENDQKFNVHYHLELIAEDNNQTPLPVYVNIVGPDGVSLTGGRALLLSEMPVILREGVLRGYQQNFYTIHWAWGFEYGSDEYDTLLGNLATEHELSCGFRINIVAEQTDEVEISEWTESTPVQESSLGDGEASSGKDSSRLPYEYSLPEQESTKPEPSDGFLTGDSSSAHTFCLLLFCSSGLILILFLPARQRKRR